MVVVPGTIAYAIAGSQYVITNANTTTIMLPPGPTEGTIVIVTVANGLVSNIVGRNGQTIFGLTEDLILDSASITVSLRFANNTWRFF